MLAIPMLESLAPRARAGGGGAPKRLVIVQHGQGRLVGNGQPDDWWSPSSSTGPLPPAGTAPSPMLAALARSRDEIVTIDGIDNLAPRDGDGGRAHSCPRHHPHLRPASRPGVELDRGVDRPRRRDAAARRRRDASLDRPAASATPYNTYWDAIEFYGAKGTEPTVLSGNPGQAVEEIFGPPMTDEDPARPLPRRCVSG